MSADELEYAISDAKHWIALRNAKGVKLSEADFSECRLVGLDFSNLDLESCDFTRCTIEKCDFSRCNLYGAIFDNAQLLDSDFSGSVLTGSNFDEAELTLVDFSGCELSGISFQDSALEKCELSRSRGLSQYSIDQAVGDTGTSIPQFLDYPEHWVQTKDEKEEKDWMRRLSAFRGDDILFCKFDGAKVGVNEFRNLERDELKQSLEHLQKHVQRAIGQKLLHNDCPTVYVALVDYYHTITSSAGDDKPRWPLKLSELEQIKVGLEGNSLISQTEALRSDIESAFPHKIAQLDHIISTHLLLVSGLERWRSFVQGAGEAKIADKDIEFVRGAVQPLVELMEDMNESIDPKIPETIKVLQKLASQPKEVAKLGAYGIVRCFESVFASIFVYIRRMATEFGDQCVAQIPKNSVRLVVAGLLSAGVMSIFSLFPHLATWISGGITVLRGLGLLK